MDTAAVSRVWSVRRDIRGTVHVSAGDTGTRSPGYDRRGRGLWTSMPRAVRVSKRASTGFHVVRYF